jgi:hypothetical protein
VHLVYFIRKDCRLVSVDETAVQPCCGKDKPPTVAAIAATTAAGSIIVPVFVGHSNSA